MKQYKFSLKDECMKEETSMKYPSCDDEVDENLEGTYKERCIEYLQHQDNLESIPVPKEHLNKFQDNRIYTEGEFQIKGSVGKLNIGAKIDSRIAIPSQEVEDTELLNNKNKPEYIICAAIHFNDGEVHVHQPRNILDGFVICGRRHHNCFMAKTLSEYSEIKGTAIQGFLTSKDRFLNRALAGELAFNAGQINEKTDCLFSEDLY